jgi:hypothetical protein
MKNMIAWTIDTKVAKPASAIENHASTVMKVERGGASGGAIAISDRVVMGGGIRSSNTS